MGLRNWISNMAWLLFICGGILWLLVGFKVTPAIMVSQVEWSPKLISLCLIWLTLTFAAIACLWYGFVAMGKEELGVGDD